MKFACTVAEIGDESNTWQEHYDKPLVSDLPAAEAWARLTVSTFNATLRPGEKPRTLLSVAASESNVATSSHVWEKTSLTTQVFRGSLFDTMRCKVCGITGKRYGLHAVKRDSQFRAKGFELCAKSIELLKKRELRAGDR